MEDWNRKKFFLSLFDNMSLRNEQSKNNSESKIEDPKRELTPNEIEEQLSRLKENKTAPGGLFESRMISEVQRGKKASIESKPLMF